ncbi:MAG: hypothetical protein ACLU9S_18130 [Oscillospiraceae bacterium]
MGALLIEAREAVEQAMHLVCASDLFQDVARGAWYHDGVGLHGTPWLHGRGW